MTYKRVPLLEHVSFFVSPSDTMRQRTLSLQVPNTLLGKCEVRMRIHRQSIAPRESSRPIIRSRKAVMQAENRSLAWTRARDRANHIVYLEVESVHRRLWDLVSDESFVDDPKDRDDVRVLRLRDELDEDPDVIQCPIGIGETHHTGHYVVVSANLKRWLGKNGRNVRKLGEPR